VVDKIVATANLSNDDVVLEVGPGKGILTQTLLRSAGKVIAVEKDDALIYLLKEKFAQEIKEERLTFVRGDILKFDFESLEEKFKIVANIPYYITGEFLRKVLSSNTQPTQMVLLVQKEVAERIAKSKKESILSLSVKVYGEPKYIQTVKAGSFSPAPKVDSAILSIENISKQFFSNSEVEPLCSAEKRFFEVVKTGFAHKRKLLINNLGSFIDPERQANGAGKEILKKAFKQVKIDEKTRAEDISLEQWKQLLSVLSSVSST
jgi:16S rRNA (adenine1518-N6/adenine1519-N6)-dimethyltransferase